MSKQGSVTYEATSAEVEKDLGIRPYCVDNMTNDPVDPEDVKKAQNGDDEAFSKLFCRPTVIFSAYHGDT